MTRTAAIALLAVLVLGLAACGGGSKNAATTTAGEGVASTTTNGTSGTTSILSTLAALGSCPQLSALENSLVGALAGAGANVKQELEAIKREAAKTPKAVRADFVKVANALGQAVDALKGVDLTKATTATVEKLMSKLESPDVAAAVSRIGDWAAQNCKG